MKIDNSFYRDLEVEIYGNHAAYISQKTQEGSESVVMCRGALRKILKRLDANSQLNEEGKK